MCVCVCVCFNRLIKGRRVAWTVSADVAAYTPYEGLNLTNQNRRKLGVFGWKLQGSHSPFYCYFDRY